MSHTVPARVDGLPAVPLQRSASDCEPIPFALTEAAEALPRRVSVVVRRQAVTVDCPPWCVAGHTEELVSLTDLCHEGESIALPAPTYSAGAPSSVRILSAHIAQYPFSSEAAPRMVLDANDDGECAELDEAAAVAFVDQLVAHGAGLRRMARVLGGLS